MKIAFSHRLLTLTIWSRLAYCGRDWVCSLHVHRCSRAIALRASWLGALQLILESIIKEQRKSLTVVVAAAVALVFSPLSDLKAAPFAGSGSRAVDSELVHSVQAKKRRRRKPAKRSARAKRQSLARAAGRTCTAKGATPSTRATRISTQRVDRHGARRVLRPPCCP